MTETVLTPSSELLSRHLVREQLAARILNGKLKPGTKLRQHELAQEVGVSQSVIREALIELHALGLVRMVERRGAFVADLDCGTLLDSYDVRAVHEGLAARLCCDTLNQQQVRQLHDISDQCYERGRQENFVEAGQLDRLLHRTIVEQCGNRMLARMSQQYYLLGKVIQTYGNVKNVYDEHQAIVEAIGKHQKDEADHRMREHLKKGKAFLEKQIEQGHFTPLWLD